MRPPQRGHSRTSIENTRFRSSAHAALAPSLAPRWGDFGVLGVYLPFLDAALEPLAGYLSQSTIALFFFAAMNRLTRNWSSKKPLYGSLLFLVGFALAGSSGPETVISRLTSGAIIGVMMFAGYWIAIRFSLPVVLIAVGATHVLAALKQGIQSSFPAGIAGNVVGIVIIACGIWYWYKCFSD